MQTINTDYGVFERDDDGIFNYREKGPPFVSLEMIINDVLVNKPKTSLACFWFVGVPTPIVFGDSVFTLTDRFWRWRTDCRNNPASDYAFKQRVKDFFDDVYAIP